MFGYNKFFYTLKDASDAIRGSKRNELACYYEHHIPTKADALYYRSNDEQCWLTCFEHIRGTVYKTPDAIKAEPITGLLSLEYFIPKKLIVRGHSK